MEIKAKVLEKPNSESGISAKGPWKKAYLVLRYEDGQYPRDILVSNMKNAEDFEKIPIGATGTFKYDGEVRKGNNGRYYLDLKCWTWTLDRNENPAPTSAAGAPF